MPTALVETSLEEGSYRLLENSTRLVWVGPSATNLIDCRSRRPRPRRESKCRTSRFREHDASCLPAGVRRFRTNLSILKSVYGVVIEVCCEADYIPRAPSRLAVLARCTAWSDSAAPHRSSPYQRVCHSVFQLSLRMWGVLIRSVMVVHTHPTLTLGNNARYECESAPATSRQKKST